MEPRNQSRIFAGDQNMCPGIGAGHLPPEDELPMDTDMTYQLVCATRELDDMWYDFADPCGICGE